MSRYRWARGESVIGKEFGVDGATGSMMTVRVEVEVSPF